MIYFPRSIQKQMISFADCNNEYYVYNNLVSKEQIVPIRFVSHEKMLGFLRSVENQTTRITLPVISYEITSEDYDEDRSKSVLTGIISDDMIQMMPNPVPYNFTIDLHIWSKYAKEIFDINEQIIWKFRDSINYPQIFTKFADESKIVQNVEITLSANSLNLTETDIQKEDERILQMTFTFLLKGWIYPVLIGKNVDSNGNIINNDTSTSDTLINDNAIYVGNDFIEEIDLRFEEINSAWFEEFTITE